MQERERERDREVQQKKSERAMSQRAAHEALFLSLEVSSDDSDDTVAV